MRKRALTLPEIIFIAGTRAAAGAGLGLLLSGRMDPRVRKGAGCALLLVGALTTIPILLELFAKPSVSDLL
jgi:hypothetical protein